jgi:hypothetical protein
MTKDEQEDTTTTDLRNKTIIKKLHQLMSKVGARVTSAGRDHEKLPAMQVMDCQGHRASRPISIQSFFYILCLNFGKSEHCSCFSVKLIDAWGAS